MGGRAARCEEGFKGSLTRSMLQEVGGYTLRYIMIHSGTRKALKWSMLRCLSVGQKVPNVLDLATRNVTRARGALISMWYLPCLSCECNPIDTRGYILPSVTGLGLITYSPEFIIYTFKLSREYCWEYFPCLCSNGFLGFLALTSVCQLLMFLVVDCEGFLCSVQKGLFCIDLPSCSR